MTTTPAWRYCPVADLPRTCRGIETIEVHEGDVDEGLWTRVAAVGLDADGTVLLVQQYGTRGRHSDVSTWDLDDPGAVLVGYWVRELERLYSQHVEEDPGEDWDDEDTEDEDSGASF